MDSHLYFGVDMVRGNCCVCPLSQEWVSAELSKEYALMKERRKAREERTLARPKGGAKKHEPKGPGANND